MSARTRTRTAPPQASAISRARSCWAGRGQQPADPARAEQVGGAGDGTLGVERYVGGARAQDAEQGDGDGGGGFR
ncbi:hypothetical protein ACFSNO_31425 [Streptomyces cirratus]